MVSTDIKSAGWELTPEAFEALLTRLHSDREQAGMQYEAIRLKLTYFFESRARVKSDELVDETINRLAHKIQMNREVREVESFALAIARYVWLETYKDQIPLSLDELLESDKLKITLPHQPENSEKNDEWLALMRQCVLQLPTEKQALLSEYYQARGAAQTEQRRKLASKMGITENALYLKIHRLRQRLAADLAARRQNS